MTTTSGSDTFYGGIPVFRGFERLMDPSLYSPLPDDWIIGVSDIVESTRAIAANRYKAVNMAGAAVIAAVTNALEGREFPFVFGGDGASFAVVARRSRPRARCAGGDRDLGQEISISSCASRWCRSRDPRPRSRTCGWRASAVGRTCPTRCSPAVGSAGRKPR